MTCGRPCWFWKTHCKKTPNYGINSTNSRVACACWMKSRQDKPYCQHCIDFRGGEPTLLVVPGTPSRMYVSGHFSWDQSWVSFYFQSSDHHKHLVICLGFGLDFLLQWRAVSRSTGITSGLELMLLIVVKHSGKNYGNPQILTTNLTPKQCSMNNFNVNYK